MRLARVSLAAVVFVACGEDRDDPPSPAEDACEHFAEGPVETATAGASAAEAIDVSAEHTRFDLTLPAAGDGRVGYVEVAIDAAGDHTFYFDTAVDLDITNGAGAAVTPERTVSTDTDCATIKTAVTVELAVGTYTLAIDAAAGADPVLLVWFGAAHDHE